jgi:glycine/D-amino acid oxidase-like deaminating enzyme
MRPVWDLALGEDELRALDPGPGELDLRPDVLVVGGGVVGLATAVMCRRAGLGRVQVIERERCAAGPSGSPASALSPGVHSLSDPDFVALGARSLELHRALDAEWGGEQGLRSLDWLIVSPDRIGPDVVWPGARVVDGSEAKAIEPQLGHAGGAIHIPDQAWVHPVRFAVALARRSGGVATRVAMTGIVPKGGRVASVETSVGAISPGSVVIATGTCPAEVAAVPNVVVKGHLIATATGAPVLRAGVASTIIVVPVPDGRLVAGGTFDAGDDSTEVRPEVVAGIREEMGRLVPAAAGLQITHAWCCFRPGTPDAMPVIDRAPGLENVWLSIGHFRTGILMAPAAGEAVASWIAGGSPAAGVGAFSAARFDQR